MIIRSSTARANGGSQSARLYVLRNRNLNVVRDRSKSSSDMRVQTVNLNVQEYSVSKVVIGGQQYTVPSDDEEDTNTTDASRPISAKTIHMEIITGTYPTKICRGKKPMREPSRRAPSKKNVNPVRIDESENATIVVAKIA